MADHHEAREEIGANSAPGGAAGCRISLVLLNRNSPAQRSAARFADWPVSLPSTAGIA